MNEHVILFRQTVETSDQDMNRAGVQAYCSCDWESEVYMFQQSLDDEVGNHLYLAWLSRREEPV